MWENVKGKFDQGATLRVIKNVKNAVYAGKTNLTNGVRQWRITSDIRPSDIETIGKVS